MELILGEVFLSLASKAAFELFKTAFRSGNRSRSGSGNGRQMVLRVAEAVRDPACLMKAVKDGDVQLVSSLLEMGASSNINVGHQLRLRHFTGRGSMEVAGFTPLMAATLCDNAQMVDLLLDWGADMGARCCERDGTRRSAVVLAVFYNRLRAAQVLLEAGAGADAASYRTNPGRDSLLAWTHKAGRGHMHSLLRRYM